MLLINLINDYIYSAIVNRKESKNIRIFFEVGISERGVRMYCMSYP